MTVSEIGRVLGWLVRDTFRQSFENRVCWFMLALSAVAVATCLSVTVHGETALHQEDERPDFLPRADQDATTRIDLLQRDGVAVPTGELTLAFGAFRVPLERDARDAVRFLQLVLAGGLADTAGLFLALVWTAGFLPAFLAPRAMTLLLARPVSRAALFLGKVLGVVVFVMVQGAVLVGGTWLALGARTGVWDARYLLAWPLLVVQFTVFFSVSALIASCSRGVVVCVLGTLLFWLVCWGMNFGRHALAALPETAPSIAQTAAPLGMAVEVGYWALPKPADFGIILADALRVREHFATVPEFEAVKRLQQFHPALAVLTSLLSAGVVLACAVRRFELTDY